MRGRGPANVHSQRNKYIHMTMVCVPETMTFYVRQYRCFHRPCIVCKPFSRARYFPFAVFAVAAAAVETVDPSVTSKAKKGLVCTHIHTYGVYTLRGGRSFSYSPKITLLNGILRVEIHYSRRTPLLSRLIS